MTPTNESLANVIDGNVQFYVLFHIADTRYSRKSSSAMMLLWNQVETTTMLRTEPSFK